MDGRTEQHSIALGNTLHTHHSARRTSTTRDCAECLRLVVAGTLWAWVLTLEKVSWTQLAARAGADSLMVRTPFPKADPAGHGSAWSGDLLRS